MALLAEIKDKMIYLEATEEKEIEELIIFLVRNYARLQRRGDLEKGQVTIFDFRDKMV